MCLCVLDILYSSLFRFVLTMSFKVNSILAFVDFIPIFGDYFWPFNVIRPESHVPLLRRTSIMYTMPQPKKSIRPFGIVHIFAH